MARTMSVPCRRDLACYRNDGHPGDCAYPTPETVPQPALTPPPAEPTLDVERLARALLAVIDSGWHTDGSVGRLEIEQEWWYTPRELAAATAAKYVQGSRS